MTKPDHGQFLILTVVKSLNTKILKANGYSIVAKKDRIEAEKFVEDTTPYLALLDFAEPDYLQFCQQLTARNIPVIFFLSKRTAENITSIFAAGAVDYIKRPVYPEELLSRVTTQIHLRRAKDEIQIESNAQQLKQQLMTQDKMISLRYIAMYIGHEIRSPLSSINIYLDTIKKLCEDSAKAMEILHRLQMCSNRIESVIRKIMNLSQSDRLNLAHVDINQLIEEATSVAIDFSGENAVTIEKSLDKSLPLCRVDPRLLKQVLFLLIDNAKEAMQQTVGDKKITITSSLIGDHLAIDVYDTGPGIAESLVDKIFDPFFTNKQNHWGIGLNISRKIVEYHHGKLDLATDYGDGAKFIVRIPIETGI